MTTATAELFHSLHGRWRLRRVVSDGATVNGYARFDLVAPRIRRYREDAIVHLVHGARLTARRSYLYVLTGSRIRIVFTENEGAGGTLFDLVPLPVTGPSWPFHAHGAHQCGSDHYHSSYEFHPDTVRCELLVRGPEKAYTITTDLRREGAMIPASP